MAGFFDCGFARVAARESCTNENGGQIRQNSERLERYLDRFNGNRIEAFRVTQKEFNKRIPALLKSFKLWIKPADAKQKYLQHFSKTNWGKLSSVQKGAHQVHNCKGCTILDYAYQSTFPLRSLALKSTSPLQSLSKKSKQVLTTKQVEPTKTAIKNAATSIYSEINHEFKKLYNMEFSDALVMVPDLKIENKKSKYECKVDNRKRKIAFRDHTQEHFNSVNMAAFLGTRQSYNQRSKQRKLLFFETDEIAKKRVEERVEKENQGGRKRKRHSPSPENVNFDKEALLDEVNGMKDGEKVW